MNDKVMYYIGEADMLTPDGHELPTDQMVWRATDEWVTSEVTKALYRISQLKKKNPNKAFRIFETTER